MTKYTIHILLVTVVVGCSLAVPVSQTKDVETSREADKEILQSKLRKLEKLIKELKEDDTIIEDDLDKQITNEEKSHENISAHIPLKQSKIVDSPEDGRKILKDDVGNTDDDKEEVTDDKIESEVDYQRDREAAMEKFLQSLSPESFQDLEDLRALVEEAEQRDKNKIAAKKHYEGFKEHALTDSEEKEANWQNIVKELETQRDRLYLKNRIKDEEDSKDKKKTKTHTFEGVFGKYTDEVKEAVEKNLLSDVALAVHSGLRIDDIINDILGKEKATMM